MLEVQVVVVMNLKIINSKMNQLETSGFCFHCIRRKKVYYVKRKL